MTQLFKTAVFAGGCFWCTEAVFTRIFGVIKIMSGYTGGFIKNPAYREVCNGTTGHAEGIKIEYDENKVSYKDLLDIFFATHNPTTLNKQGNDMGTQYRSAIFYTNKQQLEIANAYIKSLEQKNIYNHSIVTEIVKFDTFYEAEKDHQNYYDNNKEQPYCQVIISPKLQKLQKHYIEKLKK